jgi:hypothetical protein
MSDTVRWYQDYKLQDNTEYIRKLRETPWKEFPQSSLSNCKPVRVQQHRKLRRLNKVNISHGKDIEKYIKE